MWLLHLPNCLQNPIVCGVTPLRSAALQTLTGSAILQAVIAAAGCPRPENHRRPAPFSEWQVTTPSPQLGYPFRPFHTPGVSGFKVRSQCLKNNPCLPSIPPGSSARLQGLMFQESPEDRALDSHGCIKDLNKGAKLVGWLQPSQGWRDAELRSLDKYFHSA